MESSMDDEESEDRQPSPLDGSDTDTPMNMDVGQPQPVHEDQADQRLYGSLHFDDQRHNNVGQPDIANATTMCSVLTDNGRALDTPLSSGGSMNNIVMPLVTITNAPAPAQREIRIEHIRLTVGSSSLQSVRRTGDHSVIVIDARPSSLPSMRDSNRVIRSAAQNMATRGYRRPIFDMLNQETFHGIAPMQSLQPSSAECLYNESPPCSMPQQEELGAVGGACCRGEMHIGGATNWKWIEESLSAPISPVSRLLPSCQSGNHHIATNDPEMDEREVGGACCTDDQLNNENLDLRLQLEEARRREDEARKLAEEERKRAEEERQRAEEERQRAEEERQRAEGERQTNEELRRENDELRLLMRMSLER